MTRKERGSEKYQRRTSASAIATAASGNLSRKKKKMHIMKNAYKPKSSDELKKVFIQKDLSKEDREREYQLRKDGKQKQEQLNDKNFRLLVRSPIWDRKINESEKNDVTAKTNTDSTQDHTPRKSKGSNENTKI